MEKRLRRKERQLWLRYYVRTITKRAISYLPFVFLLVSCALSLYAAFHSISLRSQLLEVSGLVLEQLILPNGSSELRPLGDAIIEVGGFRTRSRADGTYVLEFESKSTTEIPLIFRTGNYEKLEWVDFPPNTTKLERDVVFQ